MSNWWEDSSGSLLGIPCPRAPRYRGRQTLEERTGVQA